MDDTVADVCRGRRHRTFRRRPWDDVLERVGLNSDLELPWQQMAQNATSGGHLNFVS